MLSMLSMLSIPSSILSKTPFPWGIVKLRPPTMLSREFPCLQPWFWGLFTAKLMIRQTAVLREGVRDLSMEADFKYEGSSFYFQRK
jgi:hypothetical protein